MTGNALGEERKYGAGKARGVSWLERPGPAPARGCPAAGTLSLRYVRRAVGNRERPCGALNVSMLNANQVARGVDSLAESLCNCDRAMLSASATDADVQVRLPLKLVLRQQE